MKSQQYQLCQLRQQGFKKLLEHFLEVLHQQPPARELQVQQEVRPQLCQRLCQHWQLSRQLFQAKDLQPRLQAPQDF